jgi:hypothetical protein
LQHPISPGLPLQLINNIDLRARTGRRRLFKRRFLSVSVDSDHIILKQPTMADATHAIPDPQPQHKQTDGPVGLPPAPREMHDEELELHDAELQTRIVVRLIPIRAPHLGL